jgi:hypothetical protein
VFDEGLEAKEFQAQRGCCGYMSKGLGNVFCSEVAQQANGEVPQGSHDVRCILSPDLATILVQGDVSDPMEAVFNGPVASVQLKQPLRIRLEWGEACDPIGDLFGLF